MNNYDQYIRDFLQQYRSVSFEKIGHLSYESTNAAPDQSLPTGTLHFEYDKKAITTPELILFAAQQSGKNKGLVLSDIESYLELMRQILNIGNPHEIDGVGLFRVSKNGQYEFSVPEFSQKREDQKASKYRNIGNNTGYTSPKKANRSALMLLALVIVLAVLGVLGWGTYQLITSSSEKKGAPGDTATIYPENMAEGSAQNNADSSTIRQVLHSANDTADYKFIFEVTRYHVRASNRTNQLARLNNPVGYDSLITDTGKVYRLFMKMRLYPTDTLRTKDSLSRFLQRNISIVPFQQ